MCLELTLNQWTIVCLIEHVSHVLHFIFFFFIPLPLLHLRWIEFFFCFILYIFHSQKRRTHTYKIQCKNINVNISVPTYTYTLARFEEFIPDNRETIKHARNRTYNVEECKSFNSLSIKTIKIHTHNLVRSIFHWVEAVAKFDFAVSSSLMRVRVLQYRYRKFVSLSFVHWVFIYYFHKKIVCFLEFSNFALAIVWFVLACCSCLFCYWRWCDTFNKNAKQALANCNR